MKFSFDWLKEYISGNLPSLKEVAQLLTEHSFETQILTNKLPVLDIKLLANRVPDASGHLGVAREIAALVNKKFIPPEAKLKEANKLTRDWLEIKIKEPRLCPLYAARVVKNIKISKSPGWLIKKLTACGLKPINNVVDITNYVMLEYGQPLHAFDYDCLAGQKKKQIIVRLAKDKEEMETLDNEKRILDKTVLVIADNKHPLAIAGVKGGTLAEISLKTKNIVIESANFNGPCIRRTSQKLNLKTDASWRFQHNLDPRLTLLALDHAASLIQEICGGEILKGIVQEGEVLKPKNWLILNFDKIEKFLGLKINFKQAQNILLSLGFNLKKSKKENVYLVKPPIGRQDILTSEDLMAEIIRIIGFNQLKSLPPQEVLTMPAINEVWQFKDLIRDWLKGQDLEEVYNYAFISNEDKDQLSSWQSNLIEVLNPNSQNFRYLAPTLLVNLLKNINQNFRFYDKVHLFEINKVFLKQVAGFEELMFSGAFSDQRNKDEQRAFLMVKGLIIHLSEKLGLDYHDLKFNKTLLKGYEDLLAPEKSVGLSVNNRLVGVIGLASEKFLKYFDLNRPVALWEIKVNDLKQVVSEEREYEPLPRYPAVIRDLSILINQDLLADEVLSAIQQSGVKYLEDIDLFDFYEGSPLPSHKKSLSFHLIFRNSEATLTTEEVDREMKKIIKVVHQLGGEIR